MSLRVPEPRYEHLLGLIDDTGILEHSRIGVPRREHGYTTDDAARALVVLCAAAPRPELEAAIATMLAFVLHAVAPGGGVHNRLGFERRWRDQAGFGDHHGRAAWALGVASASAPRPEWQAAARDGFADLASPEGPHLRPYALAALGAAKLLGVAPEDEAALEVIDRAADRLGNGRRPWPEDRLTYANGRIPQALLTLGEATGRTELIERGLEALSWLHSVETADGHYSFTPVGGWAPGGPRPGFDQQPIEAAAMADAAFCAWRITGQARWMEAVIQAGQWLVGENDSGVPLIDPDTGACFDGVSPGGVNANRGAESAIAAVAVLQACQAVQGTPPLRLDVIGEVPPLDGRAVIWVRR